MRLTSRDVNWLLKVNGFGFVDINFFIKFAKINRNNIYRRLNKLVVEGLLCHERKVHGEPGVYRVTKYGTEVSHDILPPIKQVSLATLEHQLSVANLSPVLIDQYGGEFIPERHLRHQAGITDVGTQTHISDGALVLPDKRVAIEVELTPKSTSRLQKIIQHYRRDFTFQEVWYFYGNNQVRNKLEKVAGNASFIKYFNLSDFIA